AGSNAFLMASARSSRNLRDSGLVFIAGRESVVAARLAASSAARAADMVLFETGSFFRDDFLEAAGFASVFFGGAAAAGAALGADAGLVAFAGADFAGDAFLDAGDGFPLVFAFALAGDFFA